jgi:hypothetical protein
VLAPWQNYYAMQFMTAILEHVMGEITEATVDPEVRSSRKVYSSIYSFAKPDLGILIRHWLMCRLLPTAAFFIETKTNKIGFIEGNPSYLHCFCYAFRPHSGHYQGASSNYMYECIKIQYCIVFLISLFHRAYFTYSLLIYPTNALHLKHSLVYV